MTPVPEHPEVRTTVSEERLPEPGYSDPETLLIYLRGCLSRADEDLMIDVPVGYITGSISALTELQHRREAEAGATVGWLLVPREPTEAMHKAAWDAADNSMQPGPDWPQFNAKLYAAMLAAAPSSPASGTADHVADAGKMVALDGWVLVPREPTQAMEDAANDAVFNEVPDEDDTPDELVIAYRAMLAAAPPPPSSPASGVRVKALEWMQPRRNEMTWLAETPFAGQGYSIWANTTVSGGDYFVEHGRFGERQTLGPFKFEHLAKAAAQAHFEAAILSALGEHP